LHDNVDHILYFTATIMSTPFTNDLNMHNLPTDYFSAAHSEMGNTIDS